MSFDPIIAITPWLQTPVAHISVRNTYVVKLAARSNRHVGIAMELHDTGRCFRCIAYKSLPMTESNSGLKLRNIEEHTAA